MGSLVSLVMSDIVDSTRRWNAAEGAMAADLELHDRLIREVVEGAGGSVFKHTGDGMIAVFDDPVAAVGAAAGIQRALDDIVWQQANGLQVRTAVHSGVVYERDGDMFGTAVNKLARILGTCPAGAVLVSNAIAALLAERAPEGLGVRAVGEVTLAGFSAPEAVHALVGAGITSVGSLVLTASSAQRSGDLPPIDEELVGRAEEVAAIWEALGRARLVTLVGVGGMGKTRLALEVAAGSTAAFTDGVWWIDLSAATTADAVVPVAMAATGARETPGRTALESLCDRFANRSALIVIDNCEHVIAAAGDLVRALRSAAPEVRMVATSREALGVRGEHLVPVGSLSSDDGVTLFIERALAVQPGLDVEADRAMIEQICARLDGIPLAIELAAARCRSMLPEEIDGLLGDRFRLLRGGRQGVERHRTLQAAVAWSYEMLDDDERHVFHHLAMFAGGTLVDGLAAVTGLDRIDLLDVLDRLVARSMVTTGRTALGTRYHQLETLRQFAEDRLVESGAIDAARDRHLAWVCDATTWMAASNGTARSADAFSRFCAEVDNLRVAAAHAVGSGRHPIAHTIVAAVGSQARARPVFEVFDWVRPIQLDGSWTDSAAICAALGSSADQLRGIRPPDGPIGGLPPELIDGIPPVAALQASQLLTTGRPWREARDLVERVLERHPNAEFTLMGPWMLSFYFGMLSDEASDDDIDLLLVRGREHIEAVRRTGDKLLLAGALAGFALALQLLDTAGDEVERLADEALRISEPLGAGTTRQMALTARLMTAIHTTPTTATGRAATAAAVRAAIAAAMEEQFTYIAGVLTNAAFRLLADTEPDVAVVMALVWQRFAVGGVARRLRFARIPVPADLSEYERRAADLSVVDGINMVIAALDRLIAEQSGGGS